MNASDVKYFEEHPRRNLRIRPYSEDDPALLFGGYCPANNYSQSRGAMKMATVTLVHRSGAVRVYYLPAAVPLSVYWLDDEIADLLLHPAHTDVLNRKPGFDPSWLGALEAPLL
ncbi:MAG TPA: hypothetical protein VJ673_11475 [Aromatoleum sp.]|uniref:hypothetical protein n=1 Tax=Aromatoleum sp. TaxID=2307007 RepID=UPI002B49ED5D|nr:hypothetical protein [Aromatoleum sp.]HJV26302.1 hypothetical protein [Aromatoleum sp.]